METSNPCLIEQQLSNIKASSLSSYELDIFFRLLKEILTNLVNNPLADSSKIISKDSEFFMNGLTRTQEVQDILSILGFHEEKEQYIYSISDENLMKVESCLNLLDIFRNCQEMSTSPSSELSDEEVQEGYHIIASKKARSMPDLWQQRPSKHMEEKSCSMVKKFILSRHLKKEESKEKANALKSPASSAQTEAPSVTFNENGYFQQCCGSRNQKKDRSAITDFFHKQDSSRNKRWSVSGFNKVI